MFDTKQKVEFFSLGQWQIGHIVSWHKNPSNDVVLYVIVDLFGMRHFDIPEHKIRVK